MDAAATIRRARTDAGLSLRELAVRAGTSHATLSAYEHGRTVPTAATLDRVVSAAGFALDVQLRPRQRGTQTLPRGDELAAVLRLAGAFPARHARALDAPVFGR